MICVTQPLGSLQMAQPTLHAVLCCVVVSPCRSKLTRACDVAGGWAMYHTAWNTH